MLAIVAIGPPGVEDGLGISRYSLSGGVAVVRKHGGYHGYRTWSFHTLDAARQLTVSMTVALTGDPATHEFLTRRADGQEPCRGIGTGVTGSHVACHR